MIETERLPVRKRLRLADSTAALQSTELQSAIDAADDMIFVTDDASSTEGGPFIRYANAAMLAEFGSASETIIGSSPAFAFGPHTAKRQLSRLRKALRTESTVEVELRLYHADGTSFWSDWRGRAFINEQSGRKRWIAIGRNTDQRRRAEDELQILKVAIEHAQDAVFVYSISAGDALPRIQFVNQAGLMQSGFSKNELEDAKRLGPLSGNAVVDEVVREMRAGRSFTKRTRLYRKDGSTYWANRSYQPIADCNGNWTQFICIERDISDIVLREEQRSDLIAMIGHDLRNPLTTILGLSELLLEDRIDGDPDYAALRQIQMGARRLESLAAEMVIASLIERNEYRPKLEQVDLNELLLDILSYIPHRSRIDYTSRGPVLVFGDGTGFRHVIENLLSNAAKFSDAATRISVSIEPLDGVAMMRVADRGIGIPVEDLPSIFDRATRGHNVGSRKGTGLGLSFIKVIVERNGGSVSVRSVEGKGTTFEVHMPLNSRM